MKHQIDGMNATSVDYRACAKPLLATPTRQSTGGLTRGTPAYRRANVALFLVGFATFSLLYCVQPLLPNLATTYDIDAATSSMALSLTTGALALATFASSALPQRLPRRRLMFASMLLAGICNLLAAVAPGWSWLLLARLVEGAVLGGVPAVAMAWLAEEMHPRDLGKAMGLYVAGTAFGGMMGRVAMGLLLDISTWRIATATMGLAGIAAAVGFFLLLPRSQGVSNRPALDFAAHRRLWVGHLRHPGLLRLFAVGFLLCGVFVTVFNYAGFRLSVAPFALGPTAISLMFLSYVSGMVVSPWAGQLTERFGRRLPLAAASALMMVGVLVTWSSALPLIVFGILLVTLGFFAAHAIASGWVGYLAKQGKGHASSLYLLFYYAGSSLVGSAGGWFWQHGGWSGVVGLTLALTLAGVTASLTMAEEARD